MTIESIDAISTLPHYWDHIAPVWDALPESVRGSRHGHPDRARRGLRAAEGTARSSDAVIVAAWQDLQRAQKAGYQRIAYLEHGIGQSYGNRHHAHPGGRYRDAVSLFLSPNETAAGMDRAAYPKARVEVVGCPKLDTLPRKMTASRELSPPTGFEPESQPDNSAASQPSRPRPADGAAIVAISFHWGSDIAPELRSTMGYYRDALPELAKAFHVIGHAHPRMARQASRLYAKLGIEFVGSFEDVCRRADVYVADNTSTLYEFASTGRPVVVLNGPAMRRDCELGLRFWEAALVGVSVDDPVGLTNAVWLALNHDEVIRPDREAALDIVYQPRSGGAVLAAAAITDWLAADQAVAA